MATVAELESWLSIPEAQTESGLQDGTMFLRSPEKSVYFKSSSTITVPLLKQNGEPIIIDDLSGSTDYRVPIMSRNAYAVFDELKGEYITKDIDSVKVGELRTWVLNNETFGKFQVKIPGNPVYPSQSEWQEIKFTASNTPSIVSVRDFPELVPGYNLKGTNKIFAVTEVVRDINNVAKKYEVNSLANILANDVYWADLDAWNHYYRRQRYSNRLLLSNSSNTFEFNSPLLGKESSPFWLYPSGCLFNGVSTCIKSDIPLIPAKKDFSLTFAVKILDQRVYDKPLNLFTQFLMSAEPSGYGRLGLAIQYNFHEGAAKSPAHHYPVVKLFIGNDENNDSIHLINNSYLSSGNDSVYGFSLISLYRSGDVIHLKSMGISTSTYCPHSILQSGCLIGAVGKNPQQFDGQLDEFFSGIMKGIFFHPFSSEHVDVIENFAQEYYSKYTPASSIW